jgi:hypothetical protein
VKRLALLNQAASLATIVQCAVPEVFNPLKINVSAVEAVNQSVYLF